MPLPLVWQYIKISPNLKNGELISLYDNILFIFECFHDQQDSQWREKASRKYPTKQQQNGQIVFLLSSDGLAQWLRQPLVLVYARNNSTFYGAVHDPSLFHNFKLRPRKAQVATQTLWLPIWDAIFFICTYACALKHNDHNLIRHPPSAQHIPCEVCKWQFQQVPWCPKVPIISPYGCHPKTWHGVWDPVQRPHIGEVWRTLYWRKWWSINQLWEEMTGAIVHV